MKKRITINDLEKRLLDLNKSKGTPLKPYSRSDKGLTGNVGNYYLNQAYGGYNVYQIANTGGGVTEPAGGGHVTRRECLERINSLFC